MKKQFPFKLIIFVLVVIVLLTACGGVELPDKTYYSGRSVVTCPGIEPITLSDIGYHTVDGAYAWGGYNGQNNFVDIPKDCLIETSQKREE